MRIQKCTTGYKSAAGPLDKRIYFANLQGGRSLTLSAAVRDEILPRRYVFIDVEDGGIAITPTEDEHAYKVTITYGQAKISLCRALHFASVPDRERLCVIKREDGSLFIPLGGVGK